MSKGLKFGGFLGESLVAGKGLGFLRTGISQIDNPLDAIAVGRSASFRCTVLAVSGRQRVSDYLSLLVMA